MPRNRHVEWRVPYAPGVLEARGYRGGRLVQTQVRETAGAPARLVLQRRPRDARMATARIAPWCLLQCKMRAAASCRSPTIWCSSACSGPGAVIGVGNGNPTSLEPDHASQRRAFNGLCMAVIRTQRGEAGRIRVSAAAAGLRSAALGLRVRAVRPRPAV